jgi:predicted AAA+ superfamily ATPase
LDIAASLSQSNRWWLTGRVDSAFLHKAARSEFAQISSLMGMERILSIVGPRRVGKSTLMLQTIDACLKKGIAPNRILMFNGDDPTLFWNGNTIHDVFEAYANEILHESLNELAERVYIFIDEIHALKGWQVWLKHYYDRKLKIKFVVSGSSSARLFEGSKESLLGRIESVLVMPLSFSQFSDFWGVYREDEKLKSFLGLLPGSSVFDSPNAFYEELSADYWRLGEYRPYANRVLKEYLLFGGYPEYFTVPGNALWQRRLAEDIVGQGLYRDIIGVYSIKNPERLERLLYFVAANNGQGFSYKTIADTLGCDGETVSGYLSFLEQAHLIVSLDNYSTNIGKTIRKNRKLYMLDNGIANALLHTSELSAALEGHLVEACCVRDAKKACELNFWKLNYWRDNGSEVDIVIDKKTGLLPVEVKYRNAPKAANVPNAPNATKAPKAGGLADFARKFGLSGAGVGLIVTKDTLERQDNAISVPYWCMKG